jgi:hypothetical protein
MSLFDVDAFRARLANGGARPNQFQVIITTPSGANAGEMPQLSPFLVTAASLPGQTIGTVGGVFYRGREVKLAGDKVFAPWTTTIINDSELKARSQLENWMNAIENNQTKTTEAGLALTDYSAQMIVSQLDKNGEVIRTYVLLGAWPTDISEIPLSFDANDQISSFTCTWNYQDFTYGGIAD